MDIKQVIVMRTDTDPPMRKGKMIAQGAHSSAAFLAQIVMGKRELSEVEKLWLEQSYRKICVRVDSLEEFFKIEQDAKDAGLQVNVIKDDGKTEFKEPTFTCLCIGPDYDEKINPVTKHLKLL